MYDLVVLGDVCIAEEKSWWWRGCEWSRKNQSRYVDYCQICFFGGDFVLMVEGSL